MRTREFGIALRLAVIPPAHVIGEEDQDVGLPPLRRLRRRQPSARLFLLRWARNVGLELWRILNGEVEDVSGFLRRRGRDGGKNRRGGDWRNA